MAWTTPRTWAAGEFVTETIMNAHIRDQLNYLNDSRVKYAQTTSNVGPTSGTTELDIITAPAFTPISATRLIKVSLHLRSLTSATVGDQFTIRIKEGATTFAEALININNSGTSGGDGKAYFALVPNATAASHTYKATIQRATGTGTATVSASATGPLSICVEDAGAA